MRITDACGIIQGMKTTPSKNRIIVSIPAGLLEIIEDYRGTCRPVKTRNAAIVDLLGDGALAWVNKDLTPEELAKALEAAAEGHDADPR